MVLAYLPHWSCTDLYESKLALPPWFTAPTRDSEGVSPDQSAMRARKHNNARRNWTFQLADIKIYHRNQLKGHIPTETAMTSSPFKDQIVDYVSQGDVL